MTKIFSEERAFNATMTFDPHRIRQILHIDVTAPNFNRSERIAWHSTFRAVNCPPRPQKKKGKK